ncbi:MAG TPA: hypothetical protein VHM70_00580 [Polyangiaceae bacterium]|nr:hypothetical protein [Polyangiaceae bacterium]
MFPVRVLPTAVVAFGLSLLVSTFWGSASAQANPALEAAPSGVPADPSPGAEEPAAGSDPDMLQVNPFQIKSEHREGSFFVDDNDPEAHIPSVEERTKDPLKFGYFLMELSAKAAQAFNNKQYERAIKFYMAGVKIVPDAIEGWRKLCVSFEALGRLQEAEDACTVAIAQQGTTVGDHKKFVDVMLANRPGALTKEDIERVDGIVTHLSKYPAAALITAQASCQLASRLEDAKRLQQCTKVLNAQAPSDPLTISYDWALAVAQGDSDAAEREVQRAERAGLPAASIERMKSTAPTLIAQHRSPLARWGWVGVGAALLLVIAVSLLFRRRRGFANA